MKMLYILNDTTQYDILTTCVNIFFSFRYLNFPRTEWATLVVEKRPVIFRIIVYISSSNSHYIEIDIKDDLLHTNDSIVDSVKLTECEFHSRDMLNIRCFFYFHHVFIDLPVFIQRIRIETYESFIYIQI